jgi:hypothetical protein
MTDPDTAAPRRLLIEQTSRTAADLAWLEELKGLNKTTLCNRAVQVYRQIVERQQAGGTVLVHRADGETERLVEV